MHRHRYGLLRLRFIGREYRLDWPSRTYRLTFTHMDELTLKDPFPLRIAFGELGRLTGPPDHPDVIDKVFPPGSAAGQGQ